VAVPPHARLRTRAERRVIACGTPVARRDIGNATRVRDKDAGTGQNTGSSRPQHLYAHDGPGNRTLMRAKIAGPAGPGPAATQVTGASRDRPSPPRTAPARGTGGRRTDQPGASAAPHRAGPHRAAPHRAVPGRDSYPREFSMNERPLDGHARLECKHHRQRDRRRDGPPSHPSLPGSIGNKAPIRLIRVHPPSAGWTRFMSLATVE
jgi:hypothetical protein